MRPVSAGIAGKFGYIVCGLALFALILAGGAYTHLNDAEASNHSHDGIFALPDGHDVDHGHAKTNDNSQFDVAAIHCGGDILGLVDRNRLTIGCHKVLAGTGWNKQDPATLRIEPPPPRRVPFAL